MKRRSKPDSSLVQRGFSYVGLLVILAIIAVIATGSIQVGAITQRRFAEDELLGIGLEFKTAVRSYFESTPVGTPATAPRKLEDLLKDPRFPNTKRYLRKIYNDPLTGKADWGLVRSADGGILGVYSKMEGTPIRQDNFPDEFFHFKGKKSYRQWVFVYGVVCTDAGCELPLDDGPRNDAAEEKPFSSRPPETASMPDSAPANQGLFDQR